MSDHSPRVSVGLPVHNGEKFLQAALDSILGQTYGDLEVIISDNASSDKTEAICREHVARDERVRYLRNNSKVGAARNFNRVFSLANGEYFKWAAHDDVCAPEFLARCAEALDRDPSIVLAYPKTMLIDEDSRTLEPYTRKLPTDSQSPARRFGALVTGHKYFEIFGLIRRNTLAKTPLMGAYANGDGVLLARLALLGRFEEIPEFLFFSRRHLQQSAATYRWKGAPSSEECVRHAGWFNPELAHSMYFPYWRMHYEFLRSIHMAPLSLPERMRCYYYFGRTTYGRRRLLRSDISLQIRRLRSPRPLAAP